jgi:hypothetical protein
MCGFSSAGVSLKPYASRYQGSVCTKNKIRHFVYKYLNVLHHAAPLFHASGSAMDFCHSTKMSWGSAWARHWARKMGISTSLWRFPVSKRKMEKRSPPASLVLSQPHLSSYEDSNSFTVRAGRCGSPSGPGTLALGDHSSFMGTAWASRSEKGFQDKWQQTSG